MEYELTNEVMEERARMGLDVWVCRYLHKDHHRVLRESFDSKWRITSHHCCCTKCMWVWQDLSPLFRAIGRVLCESLAPAIQELLFEEDPIYAMINQRTG